MSFTNITPDTNPNGTPLSSPGIGSGTRFFYFTFIAPSVSLNVFLSRNIYRNEEYITQLTDDTNVNMLTTANISNVIPPTTFESSRIGLITANGVGYANVTNNPNCRINNLTVGKTYTIESRTVYNDRGTDFGLILRNGLRVVPLTYVRTATLSIPLPPPPPPAGGIPAIPVGFTVTSAKAGALLTWSETVGATSYKIYRSGFIIGSSISSTYVDSHIISGAKYEYAVSAVNTFGESPKTTSVMIVPSFSFVNLVPDRTPNGDVLVGYGVRYFYYLFTPITTSVDVFLCNNGVTTEEAIIGLYDTSDSSNTNLFTNATTLTNLDTTVQYGVLGLGTTPNPTLSVVGLRLTTTGIYTNAGTKSNFRINNLVGDLTTRAANIKTYILELVTVNNKSDAVAPDMGAYIKHVGSGVHAGHTAQLTYHINSTTRIIPTPYVIAYNFETTSAANYTNYIYPNLRVFQNCKSVLENIISSTPIARAARRTNDMLINFNVEALDSGVVGQSSLTGWKVDSTRTPDFTYEQNIAFSSSYFTNGYLTGSSQFNGSTTINGHANIALFNVLLHEILHGIGIFYTSSYNTTNTNVGWSPFIINAPSDPWYRGSAVGASSAVEGYRTYCGVSTLQHIPIEKDYGAGTALSHWDEGNLANNSLEYRYYNGQYHPSLKFEIMSGFTNSNDYMTRLTAGALKDYGYAVNLNSPYIVAYPANVIPSPQLRDMWNKPSVKCECTMENGVCKHILKMVSTQDITVVHHTSHKPMYKQTFVPYMVYNDGIVLQDHIFINRNGLPYANQPHAHQHCMSSYSYMCSSIGPMVQQHHRKN